MTSGISAQQHERERNVAHKRVSQKQQQRLQQLLAAIESTEVHLEELAWRAEARHQLAELHRREFTRTEHAEADQDATDWYCLSDRRDMLCMEQWEYAR